jgi:hypothetical protein
MKHIQLFENFNSISENLQYHIDNNLSLIENIFRPRSDAYFELLHESRTLFDKGVLRELNEEDELLFANSDIGKFGYHDGMMIPLDFPMVDEEDLDEAKYQNKEVQLNKPMRSSGPKKYKVYVKSPKTGKVVVVHFGDAKGGLTSKVNNPEARRNFAKRHNCAEKVKKANAKLTPGYWSCVLPRFKNLVKTDFKGYW